MNDESEIIDTAVSDETSTLVNENKSLPIPWNEPEKLIPVDVSIIELPLFSKNGIGGLRTSFFFSSEQYRGGY